VAHDRITRKLYTTVSGNTSNSGRAVFLVFFAVILLVTAVLFRASFHPDKVIFSNDGPLGITSAKMLAYPEMLTGAWYDLNWLGISGGSGSPNLTAGLLIALKPVYYGKFLAPISVLFLGVCAWVFFHRLGLSAGPSILAALAMALNSNILSNVCWGLGSRGLAVGMFFLALAAIVPDRTRLWWIRVILCGLCIGMAVMEAGDNGAIMSFYLAAFVLFQAWNEAGVASSRILKGITRVAVIAVFAGIIATQGILALYTVAIKNVAGATEGSEVVRDANEHWDWATQWSLPKGELLRVIIPGLYGYRMDTEEGGNYWGAVGRTPGWEESHAGIPRHSGAGEYAGVLVVLIAIWAIAQGCRKDASIYSPLERRWIWFWTIAFIISAALAIGRYGPFYRIVYSIPYFSAIRNPMKFMHPGHVAIVILFAYGLQGMLRRYLTPVTAKARAAAPATTGWWRVLPGFERKWIIGSVAIIAVSLVGWMAYAGSRTELERHLTTVGFRDPAAAKLVAGFSIAELGWYVLFLALSVGVITLIIKGTFTGPRAKVALALLGFLLVVDLGRANSFWIIPVNYKQKYASNPVIDVLRQKPHEHRTAMSMGFRVPPELATLQEYFHQLYGVEWLQHLFPYFNLHSLEVTQLSRRPEEYVQFEERTFQPSTAERARIQDRHWELTSTRYILGLSAYEPGLNSVAPGKLKVHSRYTMLPKPGVTTPRTLEDFTVEAKADGPITLFEHVNPFPRAKLFTQWQLSTNTQETLAKLADVSFDPHATVLLSEPLASDAPPAVSNAAPGTVEITHYEPKRIEFNAKANAPSILVVTDKFDPEWKARVDGKEAKIMRANYAMRGVFLPPGAHRVTMSFEPPVKGLYVSFAGIALGILLSLVLLFAPKRDPQPAAAA
jgi:hypothetical protein